MDQWVRGANLTTGRYGHGAVACQGSAFIIGGTNGSDDLDSLEKYDHFNNIWERIRPPFAYAFERLKYGYVWTES